MRPLPAGIPSSWALRTKTSAPAHGPDAAGTRLRRRTSHEQNHVLHDEDRLTGGYPMYLMDGRLVVDCNYLHGVHCKMVSLPLPTGPTELKSSFIKTSEFAGIGELYVDGEKAGEVDMPKMHISTYSLAETFDIGCDTGTQVDPAYEGNPFPFTGHLDKVTITLTGARNQQPPDEFID
jgi:arylsulfatase